MQYQVGTICYNNIDSAYYAMTAQLKGGIVEHLGSAYVVDAVPFPGGINLSFSEVGGQAVSFTQQVALDPVECQLRTHEDAYFYGGLVIALFAAAFCIRAIVRLLWQSVGGNDDA